jgi:predicted lipoprotein with Yx(FWY)xxD motif
MRRKFAVSVATATPFAIALIAAGCGSSGSGSGSPYSSDPYGRPVKNVPSGIAGAAKLGVANSPLGRIVVDSEGRTLYLFEKDKNRCSACSEQCTRYWLPLLTQNEPLARAGATQLLLGTTPRANGAQQVTYAGHPLYRFVEDTKPGQTKGEGSQLFGAGWDVLSPAGKEIESND